MKIISQIIEAHIFRLVNSELEFLLLKRSENEIYPGLWQMVTGSIERNENAYQAALREIKEETGLMPDRFWIAPNVNSFYSKSDDAIYLIPVFAALVPDGMDVVISDEHREYRWVTKSEALQMLAWPGQRNSVETISEYFSKGQNFLTFVEISL